MGTNNKHKINNQNSREWFRPIGFLLPTDELELTRFDKLHADYDLKLKDVSIDTESVAEGKIYSCGARMLHIGKSDELKSEIEGLKMVARRGQEIPEHILDKMTKKHRKSNDSREE